MKPLQIAKLASSLVAAKKKISELESKVADFEKRAECEDFLISMLENSQAPAPMKPTSIFDFLEKRAKIEKQDLQIMKLAAEMASSQKFEIGDPEQFPQSVSGNYNESAADQMFTDYLLGSD